MKVLLLVYGLLAILCTAYSADINCHDRTHIKMKHMQICCKHPEGRDLIAEKCANKTGLLDLAKQDDENIVAMTPEAVIIHRCFSECLLVENKFLIDGKLNMDNVRMHLNEKAKDKEYATEMIASIDMCHSNAIKKRANIVKTIQTNPQNKCDPMPGAILACTIIQFFKKCPANRWLNTDECNNAREFLNKCDSKHFGPGI